MVEATRGSYLDHDERVIIKRSKRRELEKDLHVAHKIPGRAGLTNIKYVARSRGAVDVDALKLLIRLTSSAWSAVRGNDFWYMFEDHENCLINAAEKTFAVADTVAVDALAEMLHHSLYRRTPTTEYPREELISTWISQSRLFTVDEGSASFNGTPSALLDIEESLVNLTRGKGAVPTTFVRDRLTGEGYSKPNANKVAFGSPLLFLDRSGGHGHFRVTLATDLGKPKRPQGTSRYVRYKERLASVGKTDRASTGTIRREQTILAEWIFNKEKNGECAICQKHYSRRALVVAHKKKRSRCADSERLDPYIAFPLCVFGCDYLYEHGFLKVQNGTVEAGRSALTDTEKKAVAALIKNRLKQPWSLGPTSYFDNS